jgi:hypothetical protein
MGLPAPTRQPHRLAGDGSTAWRSGRPCRPASHRPRCGLNAHSVGVPPWRWPRTARLYRGMSLAQTPPGLPLTRRSPRRGSLVGGSRRGSTLPAKVRQAERRCPRERDVPGPWLGHTRWQPTVSGGHQREVDPQVAGAILGDQARRRALIRMRFQVQVLAGPPTISPAHGHPADHRRWSLARLPSSCHLRAGVREPQLCDYPHAGLNPRPDGDSRNTENKAVPNR